MQDAFWPVVEQWPTSSRGRLVLAQLAWRRTLDARRPHQEDGHDEPNSLDVRGTAPLKQGNCCWTYRVLHNSFGRMSNQNADRAKGVPRFLENASQQTAPDLPPAFA